MQIKYWAGFYFLAFMFTIQNSKGQGNADSTAWQMFKHNHWTWYVKIDNSDPDIVQQGGIKDVKPVSTGLEGGFKYTYNLGEHFGIETGLGIGSQDYFFAGNNYNPGLLGSDFSFAYIQVPVMAVMHFSANRNLQLFWGTGIVAKYFDLTEGAGGGSFGDGSAHEVSGWDVDYHSITKSATFILSDFEIGALYRIPQKNNMIRLSLDFQVSPQSSTLVNYFLLDDNSRIVGTGTYYTTVGYAGICVGYVL